MDRTNEIKQLRMNDGLSIREISKIIGCSKSVVSYHCKGLRANNPTIVNQAKATAAYAEKHRLLRESYQEEGRQKAKNADYDFLLDVCYFGEKEAMIGIKLCLQILIQT